MPLGNQSLQPWTPTTYTSMVASTYKAALDGNSSVAANVAGALYVYPNSPAGLSVLVDPGFNLMQVGTSAPFLLNGAASASTVSLTAPGSNSYYATVYWDPTTSSAGVVYGATGASPTPITPNNLWQIPIALVLLTNGQVTVTASNIYDVRSFFNFGPLCQSLGTESSNFAVNCNGATAVSLRFFITATLGPTLNNLRVGVPVSMDVINSSGSTHNLAFAANTPGGTAYTALWKQPGNTGATIFSSTTLTCPTSTEYFLIAAASSSTTIAFSVT